MGMRDWLTSRMHHLCDTLIATRCLSAIASYWDFCARIIRRSNRPRLHAKLITNSVGDSLQRTLPIVRYMVEKAIVVGSVLFVRLGDNT